MQPFLLCSRKFLEDIEEEVKPLHPIEREDGSSPKRKRAVERQQSKTFFWLVDQYFPEAPTEGMSDINLLLELTRMHVPYWQHPWYPLLANLVKAMIPCVGTQRVTFSRFTAIFKQYWVPKEGMKGPHVMESKKWLKADREKVDQYIQDVEKKLVERLQDIYVECYPDLERKVKALAISEDPQEILLAILMSAGMRRGEVIESSITYEPFRGALEENSPYSGVDRRFLILQTGCFKDAKCHINKYVRGSALPKQILKPTVFLPAEYVVELITKFRETARVQNLNTKNPMTKYMRKYFPQASAQAEANAWSFGPHYCRRLYGTMSYERWGKKDQWDRSIWLSTVLAHGASVATSLSYSNIRVRMEDDADVPPRLECT